MLVHTLMEDKPFAASFGKARLAWREFTLGLSLVVDPNGHLVYGQTGISDKQQRNGLKS